MEELAKEPLLAFYELRNELFVTEDVIPGDDVDLRHRAVRIDDFSR